MGHTWREIDTVGAAEHYERLERLLRLRKEFKEVPVGKLTVSELLAVLAVFGVSANLSSSKEPSLEHLIVLEEKLKKLNAE